MNKYIPVGACVGLMLFSVSSFAMIQHECEFFPLHSEVVCSEALPMVRAQLGTYAPPSFDPNTLRSVRTDVGEFNYKAPKSQNNTTTGSQGLLY